MKDFNKYFIVGTNSDALHDTMNGMVVGELIHCEDCKNWEADEDERCMYCGEGILPVTEACMGNGFCSMAKPKETEK